MQANYVDTALGEEVGMVQQNRLVLALTSLTLGVRRSPPKADRLAVTSDEVIPVWTQTDESMLAGETLIEIAQVEQSLRVRTNPALGERPRNPLCLRAARAMGVSPGLY